MKKTLAALVIVTLTGVSACGSEWGNDAPVANRETGDNATPAEVYNMSDGFSNVATKCDRYGNRMYTIYHGSNVNSSPYGAVEVIPNDPSCEKYKVQPK